MFAKRFSGAIVRSKVVIARPFQRMFAKISAFALALALLFAQTAGDAQTAGPLPYRVGTSSLATTLWAVSI